VARRSTAEDPADTIVAPNSSFVLAANRTYRRDPLNGFRKYPGGWNISEVHYWAVSLFETLHLCCLIHLLLAQYNTNRPDFFFSVCRIYCSSTIRHCHVLVCAVFSGYARHLLPSLLLSASQLQILSNGICLIIDVSNIIHLCCNVSSFLLCYAIVHKSLHTFFSGMCLSYFV
jgi:hypothetical protein